MRMIVRDHGSQFIEEVDNVNEVPRAGDEYVTNYGARMVVAGVPVWCFADNEVGITVGYV